MCPMGACWRVQKARSDNTWRQEKAKRMAARKERQTTAVSSSPASSHNAVTPLGPHKYVSVDVWLGGSRGPTADLGWSSGLQSHHEYRR